MHGFHKVAFGFWRHGRFTDAKGLVDAAKEPGQVDIADFVGSRRSCFTIHGSSRDGFDELPEQARRYLQKIIIPQSKTHEIESRLAAAGIDELTIFPDLDGLGRWLAMILRDEFDESNES